MVVFYFEHSVDNPSIKIIQTLMKKTTFFQLNKKHENRLVLITNILFWVYLRLLINITIFVIAMVYISFALVAYFYIDYNFTIINLLVLVILTIFKVVSLKTGFTASIGGIIFIYILSSFLVMKIDEIIRSIRVNIRWRNKVRLFEDIRQYDQFIKMLNAMIQPINMILGVVYLMLPYMSSQVWQILKWKTDDINEKLLKCCSIIGIIGALFHLFIVNYPGAKLAHRNKSIHKYFYMVINDKAYHTANNFDPLSLNFSMRQLANIKFILKVDSFIARLSKQNVGFRLLNIFGVTVKFLKMNSPKNS